MADVRLDMFTQMVSSPQLFMTFRPSESADALTIKPNEQGNARIMDWDAYDGDKTIVENAKRMSPMFKETFGKRVGYPYHMYDGRGVLAFRMDDQHNCRWCHTASLDTVNSGEIRITL